MKSLLFLLSFLFICSISFGQTNVSGNQSGVWTKANSPYIITSDVTISAGQTLTIEPGVVIQSQDYADDLLVYGTLLAQGTAADSIRFRGISYSSGNSSHGGTIYFYSTSSASVLDYVAVDRMGDSYYRGAAIYILEGATPTIRNITVRNSEVDDFKIWVGGAKNFTTVKAVVGVNYGTGSQDAVMPKLGYNSYYRLTNSISVKEGQTLTIQPGAIVHSYYGKNLNVYGTLLAQGTATDSIYFRGTPDAASSFSGGTIYFHSTSSASLLDYATIDRMGNSSYNYNGTSIEIRSNCTIRNSLIRNSQNIGIYIIDENISPTIRNCAFSNNKSYDIYAFAGNCSGIQDNINAGVAVRGSVKANASWPLPGANSYYYVANPVFVDKDYTLTVEAGLLVEFGNSGRIEVNGSLRAIGSRNSPIQFKGKSNSYSGYILLRKESTNSIISFATFNYMGNSYYGALEIATSSFTVSDVSISNSYNMGLWIYYSNPPEGVNPIIKNSSFFNNKTGIRGGYSNFGVGNLKLQNCNLYGNTEFGINNLSPVSSDTIDAQNCYWGFPTGPYHPSLNPNGQGNKVSNRVKFLPVLTEPQDGQIADLGIVAVLSPTSDCNLSSSSTIKVRISNYGNGNQSNFPVSYRINNGAAVTETISTALAAGQSLDYTFTQKANLSAVGNYTINAYTSLAADTVSSNNASQVVVEHLPALAAPGGLIPANNAVGTELNLTLGWVAVSGATSYEVFVWKATDAVPTQPLASNITQFSYTLSSSALQYDTQYRWKVVAKRLSCRTESAVQNFTTRSPQALPDLVVESINAPATATSETDIVFSWRIKNQGSGATGNQSWLDLVYLSDQPTLSAASETHYLGSKSNFSALGAGQSYQTVNQTFRIPQGTQGQYYLIVRTNPSQYPLAETSYANNDRASNVIGITLAPPPDLQVTNLVVNPLTAFSEDTLTVTFTVRNAGTGPTTTSNWTDHILLSQSETLDLASATFLGQNYRSQVLPANGIYTLTKKLRLPGRISGTYYVHVLTDRYGQVYEYTNENNNTRSSLAVSVIESPTPNLTVSQPSLNLTNAASGQAVTVSWNTTNAGAATAPAGWQEYVYLSSDGTLDGNDKFLGSLTRSAALPSQGSVSGQLTVKLPGNQPEGTYYFIVKTDASDRIYENPGETDNVSAASASIQVSNPDLKSFIFSAVGNATSEQTINVSWQVVNLGQAIVNATWEDRLYLSINQTFEPGTDLLLTSVANNQLVVAEGDYRKKTTAKLPLGVSGSYYLILVLDAGNSIFEKGETNNITISPITITLAPWPDLQISGIVPSASDTIERATKITYTALNNGSGNLLNRQWQDRIYLSPTPTVNENSLIYLGATSQNRSLNGGQSYSQATTLYLPNSLAAGNYYVVVRTDAGNAIFENTDEGNNTAIATNPTTLVKLPEPPPPPVIPGDPIIDLAVVAGTILTETVTAGGTASVQWTVRNNGSSATGAGGWQDAVYLSDNAVLDANDRLLSTVLVNTPVAAGASYSRTHTVAIPAEAEGTLYFLVTTDREDVNKDKQRGNNTLPLRASGTGGGGQTVTLTLPPPADLVPTSLSGPAQGTVSQPIDVSFTVRNAGTGPTPTANWTDRLFLSSDQQEGNDILLGAFPHSGALAAGAEYTVPGQVFLPASQAGNHVLLLKTDASGSVFERNAEGNNIAFANIFINAQPPSDLRVSRIDLPAGEQLAGSLATIGWGLSNIGSNTASGYLREAVYLSSDATLDATDVLFGTLEGTLYLPAQATENRVLRKPLSNLKVGAYYVFVKTDILDNIVEQDETNNQTVSLGQIQVNVKELPLNTLTADTLDRDGPLYYRLEIPPGLAGETLSVVLKGDSANNAVNRLFIQRDSIPTANRYAFTASVPFKANQELIVPTLQAGTYYLTVLGSDPVKVKQPVSLLAKIIPFSLAAVDANSGGNTGLVTVKLTGARFEPSMTITLTNGTATHTATAVYYTDPAKLFATFNLAGAPLGKYTVRLLKTSGATAQLADAFTVIAGTAGGVSGAQQLFTCSIQNIGYDENVAVDVLAPPSVRRNQTAKVTIAYRNAGNVDIPAQTRILLSLEGAPLDFTTEFKEQRQELFLEFIEVDGPPGILRAGSSGFINVYTHAIAPISLIITE